MALTRTEQMLLQAIKAALCGAQVDWSDASTQELDELMRLALQHKLQPMTVHAIYACPAVKNWPALDENRQRAKAQVVAQTAKTAEFLALYQAFQTAGCLPLVIKGILCRELYPNGDLRQSGDEDLFAAPQQFSDCCTVLRQNGFVPIGQPDEAETDEIDWHKPGSILRIELHRNLFSQRTEAVRSLQSFFENAFDTQKTYALQDGTVVCSLSEHDHLLYLILHAYKHFIRGGFGLRQVCDIGLWARRYHAQIDWTQLFAQCEQTHTLKFAKAVFQIARCDLSAGPDLPTLWENIETDRLPMLADILQAGVYGSADKNRIHSASVTLDSVSAKQKGRRGNLLKSAFPPKSVLQRDYPILKKHGILLPVIWVRRITAYRKELKTDKSAKLRQTVKLANERKKLFQRYDIL